MADDTQNNQEQEKKVEIDPNDPIARFVALKMKVKEQQQGALGSDISDEALQRDLAECEKLSKIETTLTPDYTSQVLHDLMSQVVLKTRVSRKQRRDIANTHCRVLMSLLKRQKQLGPTDVGISLAMIKQDITPKCRHFVELVLQEASRFGIVLITPFKGKFYYALNVLKTDEVQSYLASELREGR